MSTNFIQCEPKNLHNIANFSFSLLRTLCLYDFSYCGCIHLPSHSVNHFRTCPFTHSLSVSSSPIYVTILASLLICPSLTHLLNLSTNTVNNSVSPVFPPSLLLIHSFKLPHLTIHSIQGHENSNISLYLAQWDTINLVIKFVWKYQNKIWNFVSKTKGPSIYYFRSHMFTCFYQLLLI